MIILDPLWAKLDFICDLLNDEISIIKIYENGLHRP